jgi:ubiquinone biosynthesis protein COQ9
MSQPGPGREAAVQAWMAVIGRDGWRAATLSAASEEAGSTPEALVRAVGDAADALSAFIDQVAREAALASATDGTVRDRLFAGFMAGADVLSSQRAAVEALLVSRDPGVVALAAAKAGPALRRLASAAGVDVTGLAGAARVAATGAIAARIFHVWRQDESPDMSATMAELDRQLARAEQAATEGFSPSLLGLSLPWGRRDSEPAPDLQSE